MTLSVREASGTSQMSKLYASEGSGTTEMGEMWVRKASGTVQVFSAFGGSSGLSASPPTAEGYTSSHTPQRINTNSVTISVSPSGPVDSVAWSFLDVGWDAISPVSLSSAFRSPSAAAGDILTTTAICTVTRGGVPATIDVPLTCANLGT